MPRGGSGSGRKAWRCASLATHAVAQGFYARHASRCESLAWPACMALGKASNKHTLCIPLRIRIKAYGTSRLQWCNMRLGALKGQFVYAVTRAHCRRDSSGGFRTRASHTWARRQTEPYTRRCAAKRRLSGMLKEVAGRQARAYGSAHAAACLACPPSMPMPHAPLSFVRMRSRVLGQNAQAKGLRARSGGQTWEADWRYQGRRANGPRCRGW